MNDDPPSKKQRRFTRVHWLSVLALAIIGAAVLIPRKPPTNYRFITSGHPIDVMMDGAGRWFYYMPEPIGGGAPELANRVRKELIPLGFNEDVSNKPWFRFVKGTREVIVCNHDEIATVPASGLSVRVIHESPFLPTKWMVLWVHEPGPDAASVALFQIQKHIYGW